MAGAQSQHRRGIALVVAAAVAWSTAPFFTRLLPFDSWTILFWRGLFGGAMIAAILVLLQATPACATSPRWTGPAGWSRHCRRWAWVCFIPSLQLTSVSNVAIIIATGPFVTAALARLWLQEVPRLGTTLASIVALVGIAIIVGGARLGPDMLGLALACIMTVAIAAMTVIVRHHRNTSMVAAAALSNILGSAVSIPFAQGIAAVSGFDLFIFAMFGFFQVALGLSLYMLGSRLLPSSQAALIATLETPLMPFWVWMAFQEAPSSRALIGGALVMSAVVADIVGDSREQKQPA
jgi:drug/metabolite transporter (DMT)-like permease